MASTRKAWLLIVLAFIAVAAWFGATAPSADRLAAEIPANP
jgi:hypothetical protein